MNELAISILVPVVLIIGFDLEYWGVIPILFLKTHHSLKNLGEPITLKIWAQKAIQLNSSCKETNPKGTFIGGKDGPLLGVPHTIALTNKSVLFGTTLLTYHFKVDRSCIREITD